MELDVRKQYSDIVKQMNSLISYVDDNREKLAKKQSQSDLAIADIVHAVEFSKFNAIMNNKLIALLRETALERRQIKEKLKDFDQVKSKLINLKELSDNEKDLDYTFKTNVLKDLGFKKGSKLKGDI